MVNFNFTIYTGFFLATTLLSFFTAYLAWKRRIARGATELVYLMVLAGIWALIDFFEAGSTSQQSKILFSKFEYLAATTVPVMYLQFAIKFTGRVRLIKRTWLALLYSIPVITITLAMTNQDHHLIWTGFSEISSFTNLMQYYHGTWFWIGYLGYNYLLLLFTSYTLSVFSFRRAGEYLNQAWFILLAGMCPFIASLIYVLGLNPVPGLNITPASILLSGILLVVAMRFARLLDLAPVTREILVESLPDGMLAIDNNNVIIDINKAAIEFLEIGYKEAIGTSLISSKIESNKLVEAVLEKKRYKRLESIINEETRVFDLLCTEIKSWEGSYFVVIREVTESVKKEKEVEHAEKKFKETFSLFRLMSDTMPDMLWAKDLNSRFIFVNQAVCSKLIHAVDTNEPIGKNDLFFAERIRKENPGDNQWHTFGEMCIDSDAVTLREMKLMHFEEFGNVRGKFLYLDVWKAPLFDDSGKLIGVVGSARDVTSQKESERFLSENHANLKAILENSLESIWTVDRNYVIHYVNEVFSASFFEAFGVLIEPGINIIEILPVELKDLWKNRYDRALSNEHFIFEDRIPLNDDFVYVEVAMSPIEVENEVVGVCVYGKNITHRKKAEIRIQAESELRQLLTELSANFINIPINEIDQAIRSSLERLSGFLHADAGMIYGTKSGASEYFLKYKWGMEGAPFVIPPKIRCDQIKSMVIAGLRDGEINILSKPGVFPEKLRDFMITAQIQGVVILPMISSGQCNGCVIFTFSGELLEFTANEEQLLIIYSEMLVNVNERKKAEEQITIQALFRQLLVEISTVYINIPISQVEDEIQKTLGVLGKFSNADRTYVFTFDDSSGLCSNTFEWCADGIEPFIEGLQNIPLGQDWVDAFRKGEIMYVPEVDALPDGYTKDVLKPQGIRSLISIPMMQNGICTGFIGFDYVREKHILQNTERELLQIFAQMLVNIGNRKKIETDLLEARNTAQEMNRIKTIFLANMSHELRTPFVAIKGYAELLEKSNKDPDDLEMIQAIQSSSERMQNTLTKILALTDLESGESILSFKDVRIDQLVERICRSFRSKAEKKNLRLSHISELTHSVYITDESLMVNIISNLVENAIKYTDEGSVRVRISDHGSGDNQNLLIEVTDTGIGIPQTKQEIIWQEFRQLSEGYTRDYQGVGLGLAITRKSAVLLNGVLTLESERGAGSTFRVEIPAEPKKESDELFL